MRSSNVATLAAGLVALALLGVPIVASERPCSEEVQKFCKGVDQRGGGARKCLEDHLAELSEACKQHIETAKTRHSQAAAKRADRQKLRQGCKGDIEKFCKTASGGRAGVLSCLKQHEAELSAACKTALATAPNP